MMPKSIVPFCVFGQRAANPCLNSSILLSSPKVALATSLATSMSKPTSSPLSSMKPNGGASLVTPTISLPRARISSSLERPSGCWAAAGTCAWVTISPAPATAPEVLVMKSRLDPIVLYSFNQVDDDRPNFECFLLLIPQQQSSDPPGPANSIPSRRFPLGIPLGHV